MFYVMLKVELSEAKLWEKYSSLVCFFSFVDLIAALLTGYTAVLTRTVCYV